MIYSPRAGLAAIAALALCACVTAADTPNLGEAPMSEISVAEESPTIDTLSPSEALPVEAVTPNETLLYGAMTKFELMSFVEAVRSENLENLLEAQAPLTVFAPNNQAFEFARLSDDADVPAILKGHIIEGALDAATLRAAVQDKGAPVKFMTTAGVELTVYVMGDEVKIAGPNGTLATVTQADMRQSNGIMHQISSVLLPK